MNPALALCPCGLWARGLPSLSLLCIGHAGLMVPTAGVPGASVQQPQTSAQRAQVSSHLWSPHCLWGTPVTPGTWTPLPDSTWSTVLSGSHQELEIGCPGSIYTMEMSRCYESDLFFGGFVFVVSGSWLLSIYYTLLGRACQGVSERSVPFIWCAPRAPHPPPVSL